MKGHVRAGLVAVLAAASLAVGASSALAWTPAGNYTFAGSLTSELQTANPTSLTCNVSFAASLSAGTANSGSVTSGSATACSSSITNCTPAVTLQAFNWGVSGTNTGGGSGTVTITGAQFTAVYGGTGCPVTGLTITAAGNVTGAYDAGTGAISFLDTPGLVVTASNNTTLVPIGTNVWLTGDVFAQTGPPALQ